MVKPADLRKLAQAYPEEASKNFQRQWQRYVAQPPRFRKRRHIHLPAFSQHNGLMDCDQVSGRCSRTGIKPHSSRDEKDSSLSFPQRNKNSLRYRSLLCSSGLEQENTYSLPLSKNPCLNLCIETPTHFEQLAV